MPQNAVSLLKQGNHHEFLLATVTQLALHWIVSHTLTAL